MKSDRSIVFCGFLFLLLTGCGQKEILSELTSGSIEPEVYAVAQQAAPGTDQDNGDAGQVAVSGEIVERQIVERQIVREGELVWQTTNRVATAERLQTAMQRCEGYVSEDQEYRYDHRVVHCLVIRIPTRSFDLFLAAVSDGVEHFDTRRITARDVTEEFVDLDVRLRVKKDTELRYRELLGDAKNVAEVLKVEAELGKLRSDIEATEGRLNVLRNQVSFSTLRLQFYEPTNSSAHFVVRITNSMRMGWLGVIEFVIGLAVLWPLIGVALIGIVVVRQRLWMGRVARQRAPEPNVH